MQPASKKVYSAIFWVIFSAYIAIESYRFGFGRLGVPGPVYFPFLSSIALGGISLFMLIKTLLREPVKREIKEDANSEPIIWRNLVLTFVVMLVFVAALHWLGFVLDTFLMMFFLIWAVGKKNWRMSIITALCITIASYLLFEIALEAQLPKGILETFR
jgi:putative tricarboxylic transport membrane protein